MTYRDHLEKFLQQPEIERYQEIYIDMIKQNDFTNAIELYDAYIEELKRTDRPLFITPKGLTEEIKQMYDTIFNINTPLENRKALVTVIFDGLMIEKIKTYSMDYENPVLLSDIIHDEYLKFLSEDDDEEV